MTKATWTALLERAGFTDEDMRRWHREFEGRDPRGHDAFLRALQIDDDEAKRIRDWAKGGGDS